MVAIALSLAVSAGSCSRLDDVTPSPPPSPAMTPRGSTAPAPRPTPATVSGGGPTVWYEVAVPGENRLYAAPLDGSAPPRLVVARRDPGDPDSMWDVSPDGRVAVAFDLAGGAPALEAFDLESGARAWGTNLTGVPSPGVWSNDGRLWAASILDADLEGQFILVNIADGAVRRLELPDGSWPVGFTIDGGLVVSVTRDGPDGRIGDWQLWKRGRAGGLEPLDRADVVTPSRSASSSAIDPASGVAIQMTRHDQIEVVDLDSGERRTIGPNGTRYAWIGLRPGGAPVAVTSLPGDEDRPQGTVVRFDNKGESVEVWRGDLSFEPTLSTDGRYMGLTQWIGRSQLTIVHLSSGQAVEIPLEERIAGAAIRAIVSDAELPAIAIAEPPPVAPRPPTPPAVAGVDVPHFAAVWTDDEPGQGSTGHAALLAPGNAGGVATESTLSPLALQDAGLGIHPDPAGVGWMLNAHLEPVTRLWRWVPGNAPVEIEAPRGVPGSVFAPALRADGSAIAYQYSAEGDSGVAIHDLRTGAVRRVPVAGSHSQLVAWAADGRRLLMHHAMCTEGCGFRLSYLAWLDADTGDVQPFGPEDRDAGAPAHMVVPDGDSGELLLSSIELDDADDVRLRWPDDLSLDSTRWIEWSRSGRDVYLTATRGPETSVHAVRDPLLGGPGRRDAIVDDLGVLPDGLDVVAIDPGERWLVGTDVGGTGWLVDLRTGRRDELPVGRFPLAAWDDAAPPPGG